MNLKIPYIYLWYPAKKGPTCHAYAWQIGPVWQDTLDMQNGLLYTSPHGVVLMHRYAIAHPEQTPTAIWAGSPIDKKSTLFQVMAWHQSCNKRSPEPMFPNIPKPHTASICHNVLKTRVKWTPFQWLVSNIFYILQIFLWKYILLLHVK